MARPELSLKALRLFRIAAQSGSVQITAEQCGLSISTVSQHLRNLDAALGVSLLDHSRRPMVLTPQGTIYLRYVEEALGLLETGRAELTAASPHGLRALRFGMIEDFEAEIGPEVTRLLSGALPGCRLSHYTRHSREILDLLRRGELDLGIATRPQTALQNVTEIPLLRDPFVLALPASAGFTGEQAILGQAPVPLLRYSRSQIMGAQIEAQLTRLRLTLENAFELDSTSSILALVAQGDGWAITTPSNYARARRFHGQVALAPFPRKEFARTISIFVGDAQADAVARLLATSLRSLLAMHAIRPVVEAHPWLQDRFRLIEDA
jgi:DNA-binding transcriptional LysR family regulator